MPLPKIVKTRGFFFSAVLHLAIIIFLVIGIEPSHKLAPMESNKPLMKARAVNLSAIEADKKRKADALAVEQKAALEKRLAEEKKLKDEQDKKTEQAEQIKQENLAQQKKLKQEKERKEQQKQVQQEKDKEKAKEKEIAKQKAAKEKAAKEKELTEKKRQEELKRKKEAEALAAKKKEDEKKAQEEKAKEEKARQKKAKEEKARQKALDDALAEEEREMAQAQQKAADESEIAKHIRSIAARVSAAFSYPPGLEEGLSCTLYVRMIPGGEVIEARVIKSSGSATFDRQAENAVRKASPLPVPDEPRLFSRMREIQFTFDPNN